MSKENLKEKASDDKKIKSQKNMNYSIGAITAIIAIVTLINILKDL